MSLESEASEGISDIVLKAIKMISHHPSYDNLYIACGPGLMLGIVTTCAISGVEPIMAAILDSYIVVVVAQ